MNKDNIDINVTFVVAEFFPDTSRITDDTTYTSIYAYPNRATAEVAVDKTFEPYREAADRGEDIEIWFHPEVGICHIWVQRDATSAAAFSFTFVDDPMTLLEILCGN